MIQILNIIEWIISYWIMWHTLLLWTKAQLPTVLRLFKGKRCTCSFFGAKLNGDADAKEEEISTYQNE